MTGIKDIAKAAGVSISTVSYALNGSTKVTEKTRQRIMKIAEELNYIPNAAARTLKTRKTHIIGAFLGDYSGSFYGELLKGINHELSETGYELIVCNGPESHRLMTERIVDGGIILGHRFTQEQILGFTDIRMIHVSIKNRQRMSPISKSKKTMMLSNVELSF